MDAKAEVFRRNFELLSDEALLDIDPGDLIDIARTCLAEELAKRGLDAGSADGADHTASDAPVSGAVEEELVCIADFDYLDEAEIACGLLVAASIPASLQGDTATSTMNLSGAVSGVRLMVPASLAEQALEMLATPLSDEELAAQAEAAAYPDEEDEEMEEADPS